MMSTPASPSASNSFPLLKTKHHPSRTTSPSTRTSRDQGSSSASEQPLCIAIPDSDMGIEYLEEDINECSPLKADAPGGYFAIGDDAERLLSVTEIARRPDESLYIKKCLLVNAEIDRMGMVGDFDRLSHFIQSLTHSSRASTNGTSGHFADSVLASSTAFPLLGYDSLLTCIPLRLPARFAYRTSFRACIESARARVWLQQYVISWQVLALCSAADMASFSGNQSGTISVAFSLGMTFGMCSRSTFVRPQ